MHKILMSSSRTHQDTKFTQMDKSGNGDFLLHSVPRSTLHLLKSSSLIKWGTDCSIRIKLILKIHHHSWDTRLPNSLFCKQKELVFTHKNINNPVYLVYSTYHLSHPLHHSPKMMWPHPSPYQPSNSAWNPLHRRACLWLNLLTC